MKGILSFILMTCSCLAGAQNTVDIQAYVNTYKDMAMSEMLRTGIPASITLAQGIHETLAGTSDLAVKSNNHFGIKCKDNWKGNVFYHDDDQRQECFRSYSSPLDSYRDHSDFLRNSARYGFLFKLDPLDYESWAYGLKKAGYATNVRYSQILIKLIQDYDLQQYSLSAMGKTLPADIGIAANKNPVQQPEPMLLSGFTDSAAANLLADSITGYPSGVFYLHAAKVVFAKAGTSLLAISNQYDIPLAKLIDFNELKETDILAHDQLLYLQRKRKSETKQSRDPSSSF